MTFIINLKKKEVMKIELGEALEASYPYALTTAKSYLNNNESMAEDFVQDAIVKLIEKSNKDSNDQVFNDIRAFSSYFNQTIKTLIIDYKRKQSRDPVTAFDDDTLKIISNYNRKGTTPCVEELICEKEITDEIVTKALEAFNELSVEQKEVMDLKMRGYSVNEMVEETGGGLNTVLGRLRYARINMRKTLKIAS